jgi:hypothetical protein
MFCFNSGSQPEPSEPHSVSAPAKLRVSLPHRLWIYSTVRNIVRNPTPVGDLEKREIKTFPGFSLFTRKFNIDFLLPRRTG